MNQLFADDSRSAVLSADGLYRYRLHRKVGPAARTATFIMLNPSTADSAQDDPTIRKCMSFARRWKCGRLLVVNLFAWRSTDPVALREARDPVGPENDLHILACAEEAYVSAGPIVCAWGTHGVLHDRNWAVQALLRHRLSPQIARPKCLRLTKDGHPEHPLYVPLSTELKPFGVAA